MPRTCLVVLLVAAVAASAQAQGPAASPTQEPPTADPTGAQAASQSSLSASLKRQYDGIRQNIVEAAEKMPEADFGFRPTPHVRSFAEIVGHVAESQYAICAFAKGEESPVREVEKTTAARGELIAALKRSSEYCSAVYDAMTDARALGTVQAGPRQVPRASVLISNIAHDNEHYGNMVTYLRLKGVVPPSTARAQSRRESGA